MHKFHYLISTIFGTGYFPKAPGTAGSLVALLLFWFLPLTIIQFVFLLVVSFFVGVWSASYVEAQEGDDPGKVVIDELVGQGVALLLIPKTITFYLSAFILFRLFDIFKPFPVKSFERLPSGWGIMADDVMAGIYANILIQIFLFSGLADAYY